jgi:thiamine-phosphate pyrophosphorylase
MGLELPRYYPILDTGLLERRGMALVEAAGVMIDAGARLVQIRHKGAYTREVFEQAEVVAKLCQAAGARLIVNDRADIAKLLGAGLHVGQDDLPVDAVRKAFGREMVIGFSTHNPGQITAASGDPDYIALGPIFSTASKENPDPVVGLEQLREWRRLWGGPLVAIGGITRVNARQALEAGADSVAVIADAMPEPVRKDTLRERTLEWLEILGAK